MAKTNNKLDAYWADIEKKINYGLELRRPFERQWIMNLAFISGNQYTAFNVAAHVLHKIAASPNKVRAVDNIILPKWIREVTNLIKARPRITVVPNSTQEEDIAAAKMAAKAAEWYYTNKLLKKKIRKLAIWIYSTGNAFLDDLWDPKGGRMGVNKRSGELEYEGDVDGSVWSPMEIVVPCRFGTDDIHKLPWIAKYKRKDLDWIAANYKRGDLVKAQQLSSNYISLESMLAGIVGAPGVNKADSAYVVNLYIQPCKEFKRGAFFAASNGIVFEKRDYPFGEYPIEHFKDIEYPGVFWGEAKTTHAIGLQRSWNDEVSSIQEFNKRVGKPKLRSPMGSNMAVIPDDNHGEVIEYKPVLGHKPDYMTIQGLSPSVKENMERITFSLENLFSQHEVSRGTNRSDIRSGEMVDLLLEQDAHGAIPSFAVFEESLQSHLTRILQRMQVGYTAERTIKLGNTDDDLEVISFKGADLRQNSDVRIVKESSLPQSKAARKAEVERQFEKGMLGNPQDSKTRRKALRMIDDSIVDDIYYSEKQDEQLANYENREMLLGREVIANDYDNHQIHIEELDRVRKSVKYHKLKTKSLIAFTKVDLLFSQHRQQHIAFINEQMQKQMMLAAAQKGGK